MKITFHHLTLAIIAVAAFVLAGGPDAFVLFLLIGALPGTSFTVPSLMMLFVCGVLIIAIVSLLLARPFVRLVRYLREQQVFMFRSRLPRKRFQS